LPRLEDKIGVGLSIVVDSKTEVQGIVHSVYIYEIGETAEMTEKAEKSQAYSRMEQIKKMEVYSRRNPLVPGEP
jgi:hypothetical protein